MTAGMADELLEAVPADANPPRLDSGRHPDAVGSYGDEMLAWCDARRIHARRSEGWRWWQRYGARRALEHDVDGRLCWETAVLSGPRQIGKSWLERGLCAWRLHQGDRFAQEQTILHVAHKLPAALEVWNPAASWARAEYGRDAVHFQRGDERIKLPDDGSRWLLQAATGGAGVAFSLTMALVDEAWQVPREVVDGAIGPTLAEAVSPQLWLVSTAGDSSSDLMATNRAAGIARLDLDDPGNLLILEWSAPPDPDLDLDDPAVWRAASPYWTDRRRAVIADWRARSTDYEWQQQWLNRWVPTVVRQLIDSSAYSAAATWEGPGGTPSFGFEVAPDRSAAAVVACGDGILEVVRADEGSSWVADEIRRLVDAHDPPRVAGDPAGPAATILADLADLDDRLAPIRVRDLVAATGGLYDQLVEGRPTYRPHPALDAAVSRARKRSLGGSWVFDRADGGHVLVAAALAHFADRLAAHAPAGEGWFVA